MSLDAVDSLYRGWRLGHVPESPLPWRALAPDFEEQPNPCKKCGCLRFNGRWTEAPTFDALILAIDALCAPPKKKRQ